jgi:hypothetical protein
MILTIKEWFLGLGDRYHVDPIIFGSIYVGAIPFFFLSLLWLTSNIKKQKPVVLPVLSSGLCFISAYVYLIIAGRNIPAWVYLVIACLVAYGSYSTFQKIRSKVRNN